MAFSVVRAALVAVALLVIAWLVLGFRAVELSEDGEAVGARARAGPIPPGELRRGRLAFQDARRFSADLEPLIDEGRLLVATGRLGEAAAIAERATNAEPDNVDAWLLAHTAGPAAKRAEARRRLGRLDPLIVYGLP